MQRNEHISLVNALIESTQADFLEWSKGRTPLSYTAYPPSGHIVLLDKYYSVVSEEPSICLNFVVLTNNDLLLDELVLCKGGNDDQFFNLLSELYKEIESQYTRNSDPNLPIQLTDITQSLTDQLKKRRRS